MIGLSPIARGFTPITDAHLTGGDNQLETGGTLTISSGATLTALAGSTVDLSAATLTLPLDLVLSDTHFLGTDNQLIDQAVFTVASGATFTAQAGSIVNLNAANVTFPSIVVLTNAAQTLSGKTLVSPTLSGALTAAASTDLILTPGGATNNVVIGNTANQNTRLDLGTGPTPSASPSTAYFQPLTWGPGSQYYLTGGYSLFTTAAYPAGIYDYLGGIGYNSKNAPVAGDAQFGLGFESRYQNDPQGVDTEHYYYWSGPKGVTPEAGGRNSRRIYQSNVSWGTQYGAPSTRPMGYTAWGFDVSKFTVDNGSNFSGAFALDFTASPIAMTWQGSANISNGLTVGGSLSVTGSGGGTNLLTGATTIAANNAFYAFSTGNDAVLNISNAVHDAGLRIQRAGAGGGEYMSLGAAAGGSLFGGVSNGYFLDSVSSSVGSLRDIYFRASSDGGATFASALVIQPRNATIIVPYSTASTSTGSGALTVTGGVGVGGTVTAGVLNSVGQVKSYDATANTFVSLASVSASAALTLNSNGAGNYRYIDFTYGSGSTNLWRVGYAGGTANTNLNFSSGGSGTVVTLAANGDTALLSSTASTSTGTGALVVNGGLAVQKKAFLGDELRMVPTSAPSATLRLSGTAVAGTPGLWFLDNGAPTAGNATLLGSPTSTALNAPSGGSLNLRVGGTNYLTLLATGAILQTVPLKVVTATASTSTTTGSATFAGGIGVSGRTSTGSLSVGTGSSATPVTAVYSATTTLNFPSIAASGGVQDLTVTVPGAAVGGAVNIVEADGSFIDAGVVLHAIVSGPGTVTVRATNTTVGPVDPAAGVFRVTVMQF